MPSFESGKVVISAGGFEVVEINLKGQQIDVNVEDKDFVKRAIRVSGEINRKPPNTAKDQTEATKKKSPNSLSQLKSAAETLRKYGLTLVVSYRGHPVVTLGSQAHPWLSQLITRTNSIAINDMTEIIQLLF